MSRVGKAPISIPDKTKITYKDRIVTVQGEKGTLTRSVHPAVDLKIEDQFPQIDRVLCKVRVSQLPIFAGTGPLEDTVCLGQSTVLISGVTAMRMIK